MKTVATLFIALGVFICGAHALPLADEQFDYADGSLNGANGGSGWNGGWFGGASGVHPGLGYQDANGSLAATGGACHLDASGDSIWRYLSVPVAQGRAFTSASSGK